MCLGLETPHQFAADHFYTINMFGIKSHLKVLIELNALNLIAAISDNSEVMQLNHPKVRVIKPMRNELEVRWKYVIGSTLEVCS